MLDRTILDCFVEMSVGNMDSKGISGKVSDGNEKHVCYWKLEDR